jgi:hypothetical protein
MWCMHFCLVISWANILTLCVVDNTNILLAHDGALGDHALDDCSRMFHLTISSLVGCRMQDTLDNVAGLLHCSS